MILFQVSSQNHLFKLICNIVTYKNFFVNILSLCSCFTTIAIVNYYYSIQTPYHHLRYSCSSSITMSYNGQYNTNK